MCEACCDFTQRIVSAALELRDAVEPLQSTERCLPIFPQPKGDRIMGEPDYSMALCYLAENFDLVTGPFSELSHDHRLKLADMFLRYAQAAAGDDWLKLISRYVTLH
jgi:hypothetical protein